MPDADPQQTWWQNWGTLASVAGVLTSLGLFAAWTFGVYQSLETKEGSAKWADKVRAELLAEIGEVRKEENRRGLSDRQKAAWAAVQSKRIEVVLLRNRVNDCNGRKIKSQMEEDVCTQYVDEFREATRVFTKLQADATNASRGDQ